MIMIHQSIQCIFFFRFLSRLIMVSTPRLFGNITAAFREVNRIFMNLKPFLHEKSKTIFHNKEFKRFKYGNIRQKSRKKSGYF